MIQYAINDIARLKIKFPEIHSISVVTSSFITVSIPHHARKEITFSDSEKMLDWFEKNLNQKGDY